MILFSTFLLSTIITILLMPIFINLAFKLNLLDVPNDRKIRGLKIMSLPGCEFELALKPMVVYRGFESAMLVDPIVPEDRAGAKPKKD
jgi:hypothetical protein